MPEIKDEKYKGCRWCGKPEIPDKCRKCGCYLCEKTKDLYHCYDWDCDLCKKHYDLVDKRGWL